MTTIRRLFLVFVVALALHAGPAGAQTPVFQLDTDEATFATVFRVDPATGQLTLVGGLPANLGSIASLAAASDNLLYAVAQGGDVLEITVSPFSVVSVGNIGANVIVGLAFANGGLYAVEEVSNALYRIELAPLSLAFVGQVRFANQAPLGIGGGDLAADGSGNWLLWTNTTQALYQLDIATAVVAPVPVQGVGLGFTTGLAFDYLGGGDLLGSVGQLDVLRTLDRASGQALSAVTLCVNCPAPYDAQFGDLASPQAPCPQPQGFWRNNPGAWPVTTLTLGTQVYAQGTLIGLLGMPVRGDASLILAAQLIAAKLNVADGLDSTPVAPAITTGDALFGTFPGLLPYRVASRTAMGRAMTGNAAALERYNSGALTPDCSR